MTASPSGIYLARVSGTSIVTGAAHLNNKYVYIVTNIISKKLCTKVSLLNNTSIDALTKAIHILPKVNKNARRIHWILIKEA